MAERVPPALVELARGEVGEEFVDWMLALTRENMKAMYEACGWGWNNREKRDELGHAEARYIIALSPNDPQPAGPVQAGPRRSARIRASDNSNANANGNSDPRGAAAAVPNAAGFIHYRIELENSFRVAYLYEIQVSANAQGQGVGLAMVRRALEIARRERTDKAMLTTLKCNPRARQFYVRLGFVVDEDDPALFGMDKEYEIMSVRVANNNNNNDHDGNDGAGGGS